MASIIGLLVLFLATLTLGGCAGMPLDLLGNLAGGGTSGYGYGGSCAQPYGGGMPGYFAGAPSVVYVPQPQPYYVPQPYAYNYDGASGYAPAPPPGVERRFHQGRRDGSLPPREAQRQWAEQRHLRGAEGRMRADGNFSPHEQGRPNGMQNRANQDIYGARHNGMGQPGNGPAGPMHPMVRRGGPEPQPGNGPVGPMGSRGQHQSNDAQMQGPMQPQARSMQPGAAPRARGIAEAPPGQ